LAQEIAEFWLSHGVDAERGGFHGFLDREGRVVQGAERGAIQQARHLWAFSTWYERREKSERIARVCHATKAFLKRAFRDPSDGLYCLTASEAGAPQDHSKILYAQGFAIYGLAAHASAFGDADSRELGLECFHTIDRLAHDPEQGGYLPRGAPLATTPWLENGALKDTNTHIHLMEPFTALYDVAKDELLRARLFECGEVVARKLLQPAGYVHEQFTRDWQPVGPRQVSYGHDIETAWLLLDAGRALGEVPRLWIDAALTIARHSCAFGYDAHGGGFFDRGLVEPGPSGRAERGQVTNDEKVWWAQFEALAGLFWMWRLSGDAGALHKLSHTLDWIEGPARDPEHREWYWGVYPDGRMGPRGDHKGELWKASYHNLRAVLLTQDWIEEALTAK
jgi:mannobiose 2-epimerase